jgi:hypothetical protein
VGFLFDTVFDCQVNLKFLKGPEYILPTQIDLWTLKTIDDEQFTKIASVQPSYDEEGNVWFSTRELHSATSRAILLNFHSDKAGVVAYE